MNKNTNSRVGFSLALSLIIAFCAIVIFARSGYAQVSVVTNADDSGPGSLRQALSDTASGGTIEFALPPDTVITVVNELVIDRPLVINGASAENLSVSGGNGTRVFYVTAPATLIGFTVKDGVAAGSTSVPSESQGGGVRFVAPYPGASLVLHDMRLRDNSASAHGGGLAASGEVSIFGGSISGNFAQDLGGGAYIVGTITLNDVEVLENVAGAGGGIYIATTRTPGMTATATATATPMVGVTRTPTVTPVDSTEHKGVSRISGTRIERNFARISSGGGIAMQSGGTLEIDKTRFLGNRAALSGGAGLIGTLPNVSMDIPLTVRDSQFVGNNADGLGGALHTTGVGGLIQNSLFARNRGVGAVIYVNLPRGLQIEHTTLVELGQADTTGIRVRGTQFFQTVLVRNSIIANCAIGIMQESRASVTEGNTLFYGNSVNRQGNVRGTGGSNSGDPAFVNVGIDDYHLGAGSAAIDAGANLGVTTDFEGDARPQGAAPDIGFDEAGAGQ